MQFTNADYSEMLEGFIDAIEGVLNVDNTVAQSADTITLPRVSLLALDSLLNNATNLLGPVCRCGNCSFVCRLNAMEIPLEQIPDLTSRIAPGEPVPAGECPHCHALMSLEQR